VWEKDEGKRTLERSRRRWENEFKMDLEKWNGSCTGILWLGIGTNSGLCDWSNECFAL
jgi:hypothetical protein